MGLFDIFKIGQFKTEIERLKAENNTLQDKLSELGAADYYKVKEMTTELEKEYSDQKARYEELLEDTNELQRKEERLTKNIKTQTNKLNRSKELVKAVNYSLEQYLDYEPSQDILRFPKSDLSELEEICPSIILKLHCMDVKDLRKAYKENDKQIDNLLKKYSARYTTKANQAIYKLMVIALLAELQNILYNLKYEKLDVSVKAVKDVTQKY